MVVEKKWILKHNFDGLPKRSDFELSEKDVGPLEDGEIAYLAEYVSVDPYQRMYVTRAASFPMTMMGSIVAKVTESRHKDFPVGSRVVAYTGWHAQGKINVAKFLKSNGLLTALRLAPKLPKSVSTAQLLGAVGMPGNTAYFGLLEICNPKAGETVVVNGAAGAVGSLVGQIAKIKGCRVIGFAGSDEKVAWLKNECGFDFAFNYKTEDTKAVLGKAAPKGVDCFFDNVGGEDAHVVMRHMNNYGRVACCGAISGYNATGEEPAKASTIQGTVVSKQLKMEGFLVGLRWDNRWNEGLEQMAKWIAEDKIKVKETVVKGFENTPEAFIGLFTGKNTGKMVVKV